MALPAVGDLHTAFFSASKTAAWPLQTLPCWPFHLLSCHWLFQLSGICTELFFPVPRLPPGPFNPFPAASSGLSTCCLANANGFSSCRGSAQSFFFRFQDCRSPSNPSLQRRFWNGCLLMPMALPAVKDLHRAFFSASKTAAWPLQTLPCSVQWPFHLLSCKRQWLCQLSGICTVLFFPIPRPPPGLPAASCGKCQWFPQLAGICTELLFPVPTPKPWPAASNGLWNGCVQKPMAFPAVGDL